MCDTKWGTPLPSALEVLSTAVSTESPMYRFCQQGYGAENE